MNRGWIVCLLQVLGISRAFSLLGITLRLFYLSYGQGRNYGILSMYVLREENFNRVNSSDNMRAVIHTNLFPMPKSYLEQLKRSHWS